MVIVLLKWKKVMVTKAIPVMMQAALQEVMVSLASPNEDLALYLKLVSIFPDNSSDDKELYKV